jgi:peroxiredoxin
MRILFFVIAGFVMPAAANAYEIVGYAPRFVGQKVTLYTYHDYITMSRVKIGEGLVSPVDSLFHIELKNKSTIKGIIEIDKTESELYLAPETNYDIYFLKAVGQANSFQNKKTEIVFFGLDSTDINFRVIQYNSWFDMFVALHQNQMGTANFHMYLDTFKVDVQNAYKDVKDEYFLTYVRYNIAEMDQAFNRDGESRLDVYLTYIQPFPVYYENDQYMRFLRRFFAEDFGDYIPEIETPVFIALGNASPTELMAALKKDLFLANPQIREIMMVDKLGRAYYNEPQFRKNILVMLDSVSNYAKFEHSSVVARNVKRYLTSIEPGFPAPHIKLENPTGGDPITWDKYKGKFVYFNFFETWNTAAITELKIMTELQKKYSEDVSFLSVCTDKDTATFNAFKKANPAMNWDIIYIGPDHELVETFEVVTSPSYFLIDQDGFIILAPAPSPSPDGEYESIDKTFFIIQKALHPEEHKKVGEP